MNERNDVVVVTIAPPARRELLEKLRGVVGKALVERLPPHPALQRATRV